MAIDYCFEIVLSNQFLKSVLELEFLNNTLLQVDDHEHGNAKYEKENHLALVN